jgi:phenylalanyl-tRNA synthetase beta chain
VAMVAWGQVESLFLKESGGPVYSVKGAIEKLISVLQGKVIWKPLTEENCLPFLHPGQAVGAFYEGRMIGFCGSLHPAVRAKEKIREDVGLCELDLGALMRGQPRAIKMKPISKFPRVERDLAILKPVTMAASDVIKEVEGLGIVSLQRVSVFDVFRGANISEGMESVGLRFEFQSMDKTMTDDDLVAQMKAIQSALETKLKVQVR